MTRRLLMVLVVAATARLARAETAGTAGAPPATETAPGSETAAPVEAPSAEKAASVAADSIPRARMRVQGAPIAVMRAGPGAEHPIVATALENDVLVVDAGTGEWLHAVSLEGVSGWVHESLLANDVDRTRFGFVPDPGRHERQGTMLLVAYAGSYAADREDNAFLFGGRFGYAFSSRFTFEAGVGRTQVVRSTYVIEQLYGLRLEEESFDVFFYETGVSMDILPRRRVTPFVGGGVGATVLNARVEPTWYVALGTRAWLTRSIGLRWEVRDHRLEVGNQFTRFAGDNLEFSAGTELLF